MVQRSYSKSAMCGRLATGMLICMHVLMCMYYIAEVRLLQYRSVPARQDGGYAVLINDTNITSEYSSNHRSTNIKIEQCQRRLPGAIVAGIQKCGTAALMVFLNLHPQIAAAVNPKFPDGHVAMELKFFTKKYNKGLDWYRKNMPCSFSNQITIEKDPPYFYHTASPQRIKKMDPATKIIFIVKEPIARAISNYAMTSTKQGAGYPSFKEKVLLPGGGVNKKCRYIKHSSYVNYIDPWIGQFDLKQIHFVDGHNFEAEPAHELKNVERFLNIEPFFKESMFFFNETKGKPCYYSDGDTATCLGKTKGRVHANISESLKHSLQIYFKPLNELFFRKIKTRFSWGY